MTRTNKRTMLLDGVYLSEVIDPKLKTTKIKFCFLTPLQEKTASAYALSGELIASSNAQYPSNAAMNRALHLLYGADLSADVTRQGDYQMISLTASSIADAYTMHGEEVFGTLLSITLGCLTAPNLAGEGFNEAEFAMKQRELIDTIDAQINDKRHYAVHQACSTTYQNEPAALLPYGTKESATALTPKTTYNAWQELLQTAHIEIFYVSPTAQAGLADRLCNVFTALGSSSRSAITFITPSPVKKDVASVRETLPVEQCKFVLTWKSTCANRYANKLLTLIFGGTPSSKLFTTVREKMSLCYYCAASFSDFKQTMIVDCGIESDQVEKARDAIIAQLDAIANGDFSDIELATALMYLHNSLKSIGDTTASYINWYFGQIAIDNNNTPEEEETMYAAVTREDIIAAAKALTLDTLYTMDGE